VLHPRWYVYETAFGEDERLVFQPELDFATQIVWVIKVRPEKGKELVRRMGMGLRPTPLAHSLEFLRADLTKREKPHTLRIEASGSHLAVQPQYVLQGALPSGYIFLTYFAGRAPREYKIFFQFRNDILSVFRFTHLYHPFPDLSLAYHETKS
jgi:hypothetical protein